MYLEKAVGGVVGADLPRGGSCTCKSEAVEDGSLQEICHDHKNYLLAGSIMESVVS